MVKFGITSGDYRPRLSAHRKAGYRTHVRLLTNLPDGVAAEMERDVIASLELGGLEPVHGREWFGTDALPIILDIADNYSGPGMTARVTT
jgi:hypothetical protein